MDTMCADGRKMFEKAKADLKQGVPDVQKALNTFVTIAEILSSSSLFASEILQGSGSAGSSSLVREEVESDLSKYWLGFPLLRTRLSLATRRSPWRTT